MLKISKILCFFGLHKWYIHYGYEIKAFDKPDIFCKICYKFKK